MLDPRGGHHGGRDHDGRLRDDLPRSGVLGARLLWSFAEAARRDPGGGWQRAAHHCRDWLLGPLWDHRHGGIFWQLDSAGRPLASHKQTYAQGFAVYALAAWHRCSGETRALEQARQLFGLLEQHARDPRLGGYLEGCDAGWRVLPDARLSDKEPAAHQTMNTLLHVLEGFTELLRLWPDATLATRVRELITLFLQRVWQPATRQFGLFFDDQWRCLTPQVSYGHDIEAAWLLVRAAEVLGDPALLQACQGLASTTADAVLNHGVAPDGSLWTEGEWLGGVQDQHRITNDERHWWPQAEAMVGFWDAWQHGGDPRHAQAAWRVWQWTEQHLCEASGLDWRKVLDGQGHPKPGVPRAGPWECPYHHLRACFELMDRLHSAPAAALSRRPEATTVGATP
jgi:mannobiose 2-epimerase